ncbi:hypothetical protein XAPC_4236 [Xanthomonas citri pv. punicae str. LMG 859]|nr:hypothetical protein XAPC_4236 [Xanthomonas citri pv. punicae str. LMG 859]
MGKRSALAGGDERARGGGGNLGHCGELVEIHRIAAFGTGGDVGDLTLIAGCAHRHGVGARGDRVGTQRNRIGAAGSAVIPQRRAQFAAGPGFRTHGRCAFAGRIGEVTHRGGFGAGGFAQRADRSGVRARRNRAGAERGGGFATGLGLHEEAQTGDEVHRAADCSAAGAAGAGLGANRSGVIAPRIGDRTERRCLRACGVCTHAERRGRKAIGIGAGADCGSADAGTGGAGGDRHAAVGDQRLAVFVHCSAAHGHARRTIGLCVVAECCAVLARGQRIGADRGGIGGHRIGAGSQRGGRRAHGIGGIAGGQRAVAFDIGADAVFARGRLEECGRVFGHIGHVAQLRNVDRIGGIDAGSDVGDAARGRATAAIAAAHRHHVVFVGARACAQRHRICAGHPRIGAERHAVFAALAHETVVADGHGVFADRIGLATDRAAVDATGAAVGAGGHGTGGAGVAIGADGGGPAGRRRCAAAHFDRLRIGRKRRCQSGAT